MVWKKTMMRARATAVLTAAVLTAAACGYSGGGKQGTDVTLVAYTGQASDYQVNFNPYTSNIGGIGTIFEPLFFFNVLRAEPPQPRLGTAYSWNADGTQLSITLRDGVKWSDGEAFTAQDVLFTLDMLTKHKEANGVGYSGTATASDDTHIVIKFGEPSFVTAPNILGRIYIVPEHKWKAIANPAADPISAPVGTGPFTLAEFKPQAFTYAANPNYWDGAPAVKKVRFLALSGNQSGQQALQAGQLDWQTGPVPDIKNIEKNYPGYRASTVPLNQIVLDTCSNTALGCTGPQTDPAVRKAIYHALNRTQINTLAFENTSSEISPGFALLNRDDAVLSPQLQARTAPMQPDVAKAQQQLETAGYVKGADGIYAKNGKPLSLTALVVTGWSDYITTLSTVTQQLKQAGIKLTVQQLSWNEWTQQRQNGKFQLILDSLNQGPAPDPYYLYSYFFATSTTAKVGTRAAQNWSRFSDPEVDRALAGLTRTDPKDTAARQPYYDTIQTRIEQTMPYIPVLTQGTITEYHASKFTGWPTQDDLYAVPAVWQAPDNAEVMKRLRPTGN
ncbi:ABC transporter substrate-binding protein [Actinoplanes sp. ATCC 53533]|uniref:ABC transporter substrate-binding protein n=1 Tax=Actinoplanes sp. ATCC 53533 TaxID=1288362 RepID=UPI0018F6354C|nr:ABC transporter substrate-binding protein [Actinoplanes sp. ATCC 53533]